MKKILFFYIITILVSCSNEQPKMYEILSPNKMISLRFEVRENGKLFYSVRYENENVLNPSRMGFIAERLNLSDNFQVVETQITEKKETWTQPWGENKINTDHHNELEIQLKNSDVNLTIRCRVFNDGVGFRYEYKANQKDSIEIKDELTQFCFASNGVSWATPANFETYELLYQKQQISELKNANTPVTFRLDNPLYISIHEAALINFPDMTLKKQEDDLLFQSDLAPLPNGYKAVLPSGFVTPWRTVQLSQTAVGLINSSLILNLNEPSVITDTSWIKPTKYIGIWWGMHLGIEGWAMGNRHGATTENAMKYIDFAQKNNIQSVLFEGWNEGWENWGTTQTFDFTKPYADFDIEKIVAYANDKNVKIIGHHETGGNVISYERQMEKAFQWYRSLGINMVKTGYAGGFSKGYSHHSQYAVNHYHKVVEATAKHRIMLNVHEPIKPTGKRRTYPNMMTREGTRGMEWNAWSEGNPPEHTLILPFTRMLAGPIDYTPGIFDILYERIKDNKNHKKWNDLDKGNSRVHTTLAKQIANWVVLYSPMQMASDLIENYEGHPAFQFFRDFDADCDSSKALAGEPGEFIVIVRKAGDKYFLGATTNSQSRQINVTLDFLEKGKHYKATIYADGKDAHWQTNPISYLIYEKEVTSEDILSIEMASGGGQAIVFSPK